MIDRIDSEIGPLRTAASLRSYRQELLASNIANADTPNYKAKDMDFKAALAGVMNGGNSGGVTMARTSSRHLTGEPANPLDAMTSYRAEFQANADGNTVNMDVERSAFAENSVRLEAALTFLREDFRRLQTAIQGQ